jgi:spore coat protein U domain-containing protein, fimbrial subunit CupE1/2/3/6
MRKILPGLLTATALLSGAAQAATVTTTFPVTATVLKTCSVTASPLGFGNYTPGAGAVTGSTTVSVRCTNGTTYSVALNGGTTTGGSIAQRLMANGANTLAYNLFTTSGYATIWGDGTTGVVQSGTGAGIATANSHTVYGQLPDSAANQAAVTGNFSDTITVTVTY